MITLPLSFRVTVHGAEGTEMSRTTKYTKHTKKDHQDGIESDSLMLDSRKIAEFHYASPFVCFVYFVVSSVFIP
jgi:hypothetical protein